MRLHHLAITAFGPFSDTVEIDFDEVSASGLFLIRGATGAGKTSILDAVCFALYADVPGPRPAGRGLRSDHAPRDAVPTVRLEFTAAGRRFRVERSPEFMRPKRRGSGETKSPARVVLHERLGDSWVGKDTRHDDVSAVLREVLGMGLDQFSKVVLLPQGDFSAFLRASPEERRGVLERLFDISTFAGVEDWLAQQRRRASDAIVQLQAGLEADLARLSDVLADVPGAALPELTCGDPQTLPAEVDAVHAALTGLAAQTLAALDAATNAERDASLRYQQGERTSALQSKGAEAAARLADLRAGEGDYTRALARLETALRAQALSGDLTALARARRATATAEKAVVAGRARLSGFGLDDRGEEGLALWAEQIGAHDEGMGEVDRLRGVLSGKRTRHDELAAQSGAALSAIQTMTREQAAAERRRAGAEAVAAETAAASAGLEALEAKASAASRLHQLRVEQDEGAASQRVLAAEIATARTFAQDAREQVLDLREARLVGMAGELAQRLEDGMPCAVCGGLEHPAPAEHRDPVTADDIAAAETVQSSAAAALEMLERRMVALETAASARTALLAGDERDASTLAGAAEAARSLFASTRKVADGHRAAVQRLDDATAMVSTLARRADELRSAQLTTAATLGELGRDISDDERGLVNRLTEHALLCPCAQGPEALDAQTRAQNLEIGIDVREVETILVRHREVGAAAAAALAAVAALHSARQAEHEVAEATAAALADHGFPDTAAAEAAALPPDEVSSLRALCAGYERAVTAAETVLGDPETRAAQQQPAPDVDALAEAAATARATLLEAKDSETLARRTLREVERLRSALARRCEALCPALAEHALLRELADTFAGAGPNNVLRMRLSSFVLAARLEKVAELANERLAVMGDGRYRLEHSDGLAARGARSGLGLRVQDLWTGQARDTATLSGGEAFMASLALALGLADAVREEAGGFDLQTLFVDEGFGSLDDDSLEQVMGVLDGLREGGRAVGVVSHVAELRTRIGSQITVHKAESGSTVKVQMTSDSAPAA